MAVIEVYRNADENVLVELFSDLEETTPIDLTDAVVTVLRGDITPTVSILDAVNGQIELVFPDTMTADLRKNRTYRFTLNVHFNLSGDDRPLPEMEVFVR